MGKVAPLYLGADFALSFRQPATVSTTP